MREVERDNVVEMAARTQCAACNMPYGRRGVRVLGRRSGAWLIAVTCWHCSAEGLMVARVDESHADSTIDLNQAPPARPRIMYDVTYDEWLAFQKRPPISSDDVLDMHLFLRDFDGDFASLFGEETDIEGNAK